MPAANKGPGMWSRNISSTCLEITLQSPDKTQVTVNSLTKTVPFHCTCVFVDKAAQGL